MIKVNKPAPKVKAPPTFAGLDFILTNSLDKRIKIFLTQLSLLTAFSLCKIFIRKNRVICNSQIILLLNLHIIRSNQTNCDRVESNLDTFYRMLNLKHLSITVLHPNIPNLSTTGIFLMD
ncbi:MAG: hypothetical protein ACTSSG_10255 [Candidatus Heimdallarchaeaceae archaeon]